MRKKWNIMMVGLVFVLVIGFFATKPVLASERSLSVNGKGVVSVLPDTAVVHLGVETTEKTAEEARQKNADAMDTVLKTLEELGVQKESIKTSRYQLDPNYDYMETGNGRVLTGYTVTNMIQVTTKDIDRVSILIDGLTSSGVNIFNGVSFSVSDTNAYYKKALGLAVENANSSASSLAAAVGVSIGTPVKVEEVSSANSYVKEVSFREEMARDADVAFNARGASTNISYDYIDITANVILSYEY